MTQNVGGQDKKIEIRDTRNLEEPQVVDRVMPQSLVDAMLAIRDRDENIGRTISEEAFRTKWLPIFCDTSGKAPLLQWLEISGTAYESVNVIKDGQILFVVPPLLKRHPTAILKPGMVSVHNIQIESLLEADRHPNLGNRYIDENLPKKLVHTGVNLDEIKMWNQILKYYNMPLIAEDILGDAKPSDSTNPDSGNNGEFELDDFEEM